MNLSTPFPSGTQQRFVSYVDDDESQWTRKLGFSSDRALSPWGKQAGKTNWKNYDGGSGSHFLLCETWNIYKSTKLHRALRIKSMVMSPSSLDRTNTKSWSFWNPYFHEYRGFIKSSFEKRVKILCLTVQYVNSTFVYCILEWVYNKRTIFKSGFYNRFVCPHLCVCAEFQNNF